MDSKLKVMLIARGKVSMVQLQDIWDQSECCQLYELVRPKRFRSMPDIFQALRVHKPAIVVVGGGFGNQPFSGDDLVKSVRRANASCRIIICTSSELFLTAAHNTVDFRIQGSPEELRVALLSSRA